MIPTSGGSYVSENILTEKELLHKVLELKKEGKKIGLCSGSFDLLHPGHITHLISAKKNCDILIAGVARDRYTAATRKNKGRPIFNHHLRAFAISQLKSVDYVVIEEDSPKLIELIKPDVYIKGCDYKGIDIIEIPYLQKVGSKIIYTDDEKLSTTAIIQYIKEEME